MKKTMLVVLCAFCVVFSLFSNGATEKAKKPLQWWEHLETFTTMNNDMFSDFTKNTGIEVEYTLASPDKMMDSLLVSYRSNSLPDIFSLPFDGNSILSTMFTEGWFQKLTVDKSYFPKEIQDSMFEGLTLHDGDVYALPMFSQNHCALLFYQPSLTGDKVPVTYEEFYQSCKEVYENSNGKTYGLILPMTFTTRMDETFNYMMDAAQSPVMDYHTGEYRYDSKEMIELFQLLTKMWDEGLIHPSSVNFNMKEARERWAAGEAAYLIDGIWNIGITKKNFNPELKDFEVAEIIRPKNEDYMIYDSPMKGNYFISCTSEYQQEATDLLLTTISEDYQIKVANVMDQPPFNLEVLAKAEVHPTYIEACDIFTNTMGYYPYPILRNKDVAEVTTLMRTISPSPCEILNGYFSGAIKDWESELHKYNDAMTAERELAISKAQAAGFNVSIKDWQYPNFVYGESYTDEKYAEL